MPNSTSTWMVSGLKAAPIAATAIRRSQFGLGTSKMTLSIPAATGPRTFDPKPIAEYQFLDFDDKITPMYAARHERVRSVAI